MDPEHVDIDLDAAPGDAPRPTRARRRPRSWWVVAGLAALVIGLPGSTVTPPSPPAGPAGADPLPSAQVSSGALRELDLPRRLPTGDVSGDSSWCVVTQKFGGQVISAAVPCASASPR
jgi:hypothetical protein